VYEGLADPEDFLRSLTAEALLHARPGGPLFSVSLGLMAVANALVMLGLLPEPRAEAILAEHRLALERKGFGTAWGATKGELTVRPGAHGYWEARAAGTAGLRGTPLSVAAAGQVPTGTGNPQWPTPAEGWLTGGAAALTSAPRASAQRSIAGWRSGSRCNTPPR
jgi:hypothetical protein